MIATSTSPPRVPRARSVLALVHRDYLIARSYKLALSLDVAFGTIDLVVYFFVSRTFVDADTVSLDGAPSFFAFVAVGIALTLVIEAASAGLVYRLRQEQLTGTFEALVTQPVTTAELCLGITGFPFLFALFRGTLYLLLAWVWLGGDFSTPSWIGFTLVILASAGALAGLGIAVAAFVLVLKRGDFLVGLSTFGMGLLGGAFFPRSVLPDWIEPVGDVVPVRFAFDGVRAALYRGHGWGDDALVLLAFGVVWIPLAIWFFARALEIAKRAGSVGQY